MTEKNIHIISFDVPYPVDYGGVIDVYYRIKALHQLGYKIILHCFEYGRGEQEHLKEITEQVYYYKRKKSFLDILSKRPFIVESRKSKVLLNRLLLDDYPILLEGIHTTWLLENKQIQKRKTIVRTHNIEQDYYKSLAKNAIGFQKIYFTQEAKKLKKYESILSKATALLSISKADYFYFNRYLKNNYLLPASLPEIKLDSFKLTAEFILFTGNLSVVENEKAVDWIVENIWSKNPQLLPLKVAGKNPSNHLIQLAETYKFELISNPSKIEMDALIFSARAHVLVTDQTTGIKLKLLSVLQTSGHVFVNPKMVEGTDLAPLCVVCESPEDFISQLSAVNNKELTINEFDKRQEFLNSNYNTLKNCETIFNAIISV